MSEMELPWFSWQSQAPSRSEVNLGSLEVRFRDRDSGARPSEIASSETACTQKNRVVHPVFLPHYIENTKSLSDAAPQTGAYQPHTVWLLRFCTVNTSSLYRIPCPLPVTSTGDKEARPAGLKVGEKVT